MKFGIISVDDSRKEFTDKIRSQFSDEVSIESFDARGLDRAALEEELSNRGLKFADFWLGFAWSAGDIGGYIGHYNAWKKTVELNEPLLVFEDDADLPDDFSDTLEEVMNEVSDNFGVVGLTVHEQEQPFYITKMTYGKYGEPYPVSRIRLGEVSPFEYGSEKMALAYQNWALTATIYSPAAAGRLVEVTEQLGIHMNADMLVWARCHLGEYSGYSPKPSYLGKFPKFYTGQSLIRGKYREFRNPIRS